jgi:FixJ family two-component response regulator
LILYLCIVPQTASDIHSFGRQSARSFGVTRRRACAKGKIALPDTIISIVDDDASVRETTRCLVKLLGYATAAFASAEDFLKSERLRDSSCLITDVQMPGMDGVELQGRLIEDGHSLPVIFMTAFPQDNVGARVLERGACGYLSKPLDEERLLTCLAKALASREPDPGAI